MNPGAREAWWAAADAGWADPRRLYREGRRAALLLDAAREGVAARIGARPDEIMFTGEAALPLTIRGFLAQQGPAGASRGTSATSLVCSAVEHSSVLTIADDVSAQGGHADVIAVDRTGRVDIDSFIAALPQAPGTACLAVLQAANHEVGTRQPIGAAASACQHRGVPLLVDATLTLGRAAPPVDWSILVGQASTWGGPPGVGVVAVRRTLHAPPLDLPPASLPAVLSAVRGLEWADEQRLEDAAHARVLTDRIRVSVAATVPDVAFLGDEQDRLDYLIAFSCLFVDGESLVLALDAAGYAVSSGSSCVSDLRRPSHVLAAMGALTQGNVRVSLPIGVTEATVDGFIAALPPIVSSIRAMLGADDLGANGGTT